MPSISDLERVLHHIRVKLYPNYLSKGGRYIARTANDKSLSVEDVCTILKTRAGFNGKYEELLENVRQYLDEVAYQLCDGFSVNNGYYCVYPNIGGTFDNVMDPYNAEKQPITFRFRTRAKLRHIVKNIDISIDGMANTSGFIDEFRDADEDSVNSIFVPGSQFVIRGHKIKIAGDNPECGLYFVPVLDPTKAVKVKRLAENSAKRIIGIAPDTEHSQNRLEIRTQFSGSANKFLKNPRIITSSFILEVA